MSRRPASPRPVQPTAETLIRARKRHGYTQRTLAARLTSLGSRCSSWTVERWETRSETRRRTVPRHLWPVLRDILEVDAPETAATVPPPATAPSAETAPEAPTRPATAPAVPVAPTVAVRPAIAPLLRPASPPTCLEGCCSRFDCARCGAFAGVGMTDARRHVCAAFAFLLAPSAELLAALAREDVA